MQPRELEAYYLSSSEVGFLPNRGDDTKMKDDSDMLKVLHAGPLFAAKQRENRIHQSGPNAVQPASGNLNPVIVQMPRERIDPRLRYIAPLPVEGEQGRAENGER